MDLKSHTITILCLILEVSSSLMPISNLSRTARQLDPSAQIISGSIDAGDGASSRDDSYLILDDKVSPFDAFHSASMFSLGELNEAMRDEARRPEKCVPVEIPMCKSIGYNLTYVPNEFNHETQEEAGLEVHQFYPLVKINCSADLRLFLCSLYAPICVPNWHWRLPACRSLCESVRQGCMPVMRLYGFIWPERMNCDRFPEDKQCVSRGDTRGIASTNDRSDKSSPSDELTEKALIELSKKEGWTLQKPDPHAKSVRLCYPCRCREPFIRDYRPPFNEVITGGVAGCLPSCRSPAFSDQADQTFASFWLGIWASLCALSTFMIVATFLADPSRFQYPERPIVYLSFCYLVVSIGYLIRVALGHDSVACEGAALRHGITGPAQCSMVFILTYLFGMAASVWWIVLTFTWFLAAGLKWGSEAIAKYSQVFHFVAWFFPGAQAMIILTLSAVDGDPVGGLCYVGATSILNLKAFVLAPLCIYLALGTVFLLAGFVALFRIRSAIKLQAGPGGAKTEKLEKLMIRIGIFGVLYTVPAAVVIACIVYEMVNRETWEVVHNCKCQAGPLTTYLERAYTPTQSPINAIFPDPKQLQPQRAGQTVVASVAPPEYAIFMLKYFMSLVVGITSGFWIWSSKTLDSWRTCYNRIMRRDPPLPPIAQRFPVQIPPPTTSPSWNEIGKGARWPTASPVGDVSTSSYGVRKWGGDDISSGIPLMPGDIRGYQYGPVVGAARSSTSGSHSTGHISKQPHNQQGMMMISPNNHQHA